MSPDPEIDPRALRRAFGAFATGVTIATTLDEAGRPVGFTANSFASVSLDPPLLLVCLARDASSFPAFRDAGRFAVNVLGADQRDASTAFATRGADKFAAVDHRPGATGAPLIEGAVARFDCRTHDLVEAGDHAILLGRVVGFDERPAAPLGYHRGTYVAFAADGAAFSPHARGVRVAAIVERRREALLRVEGACAALPSAAAFGPATDAGSLLGRLAEAGIMAELPFVFATYDEGGAHHVVYRGAAHDAPDPTGGWAWVPFDAAPFEHMAAGEADTLRRYVSERAAHARGAYLGAASRD